MPNPVVDGITGEAANALERWFDRWTNALDVARHGYYSFEQFARDAAETWVDGTWVSLLPLSQLGANGAPIPFTITQNAVWPTVRFMLFSKNDQARMLSVPALPAGTTGGTSSNLRDKFNNTIPNGNVTITVIMASSTLKVALTNLSTLNPMPPAGIYTGNITVQPSGQMVASIQVIFP